MGLTGFNRRRRLIAALREKEAVSPVSEKKQETVKPAKVEVKEEVKTETPKEDTVKTETPKTTAKKAAKK